MLVMDFLHNLEIEVLGCPFMSTHEYKYMGSPFHFPAEFPRQRSMPSTSLLAPQSILSSYAVILNL